MKYSGALRIFITTILHVTIALSAYTQNVSGKIIDEQNKPIEFATVALYSLSDSMLTNGTITDDDGRFFLRTTFDLQKSYLKISYVGYEALYLYPLEDSLDIIRLKPDNKILNEVVVERTPPTVMHVDERLIFNVRNSPFHKNYTASDLLVRTPFLSLSGAGLAIGGASAELRINGVKQDLIGNSLLDFLNILKSENIKQIEVQMGRTADVSADLPGGVIDIILEEKKGLNGNIYAELDHNGIGYEEKPNPILNGVGGAGITVGTEALHFYANLNGSSGKSHGIKSISNYLIKDVEKAINSKGVSPFGSSQYYNANVGLSYNANKKNVFIFESKYNKMPVNSSTVYSDAIILQVGQFADSLYTQTYSNSSNSQLSITGSHNWKNTLNDLTINSVASYLHNRSEYTQNMISRYKIQTNGNSNEIGVNYNSSSMFYIQSKAEYTFANDMRVLAGLKYIRTERESDYEFTSDRITGNVLNYKFTEELPAVFANMNKKFEKGLSISVGLRGEYTHLYSKKNDFDISYFDLFPSASLTYQLKNNILFSTNYSRSIFRPPFALLNNYTVKLSDYVYSVGNPTLKAQITDIINIRLSKQRHSLSTSYSYSANPIMENIYSENDIIYIKNINTGEMHTTSLSYGYNGNLLKAWFLSANAGVSYMSLPKNIRYRNNFQGYVTAYNTIKLSNNISSNINIKYATPWIMNDRKVDNRFSIDLEIRFNIDSRLTLDAGIKNILSKKSTTSITDNLYANHYYWRETAFRTYSVRLTYNFSKGEKIISRKVNDENFDRFRL